ncbi:MAG: response regulator transcription factor [Actinobacteria bacterium]|nr:response regulator transcription factor [Actinomycetota bacterium]
MTDAAPLRVLIADDHPIVRDGLRLVLARRPDIDVVAEAADGREAVTLALHLGPDVAIVDLDMPGLNGIAVIRELARSAPEVHTLVLTMHEDDAHVFDALAAGANGFLVKGAASVDIERAVRSAAAGQTVLSAEVAARVTRAAAAARPRPGADAFPTLTDRELELFDLIAEGLDNAAIAGRLHLAPKTIRNQVSALLDRLRVVDRGGCGTARA